MHKQKFYARSVTIAKETNRIKELAEKVGIILPSTHTALFQSVYAPIDEANLNGVRLAEGAVEKALTRMVGSQANLEHMGYGWIVGIILDTWINEENEIEIIYSFAKNIYEDEYVLALEAMAEGELAVSFELLAEVAQQEKLPDGTILLHEIDFQGVGVLIDNPPAYPEAKTYEFAKAIKSRIQEKSNKELVFASQIEEKCNEILKADKWTSDIYNNFPDSSFAVVEPAYTDGVTGDRKARHLAFKDRDGKFNLTNYRIALDKVDEILPITDSITTEELRKQAKEELDRFTEISAKQNDDKPKQGGNANVTEEQKAKIEEIRAELGDLVKDISDEDLLDETVVAKIRKEKEAKDTEEKSTEEKAEETETEESEETKAEESKETEEKAEEKSEEETAEEKLAYKVDSVEIRTFSLVEKDGVETVVESVDVITVRDYNAMKEAQAKVEELEASLEAKNSEIESVRDNAEKIGKTKVQLKDNEFAKEFKDEDYLDDEKVAKAIQDQKDAEVIAERKEELKDNDYAKDFSDEDLLNDDKVELAQIKKEKDELEAKVEPEKEEIEASEETEEKPEPEMETGNSDESKDDYKTVIASIRKDSKEKKDTQKVYTKE